MNKKFIIVCIGLLFTVGISGFCLNHRLTCNTLGKIVGGYNNGPCIMWGSCGAGYGGGGASCVFDEIVGCIGSCTQECNGTSSHAYCQGLIGDCPTSLDYCGLVYSYKCDCPCVIWELVDYCTKRTCG